MAKSFVSSDIKLKGDAEFHYENGVTTAIFRDVEINKSAYNVLKAKTDMNLIERLTQNPAPEIAFDEKGKATLMLGTHQVNLNEQEQRALNNTLSGTNRMYVEQNIHTLQKTAADKIFKDFEIAAEPIFVNSSPHHVLIETPVQINETGKEALLARIADKGETRQAEFTVTMENTGKGMTVSLKAVLGDDMNKQKISVPLNETEKDQLTKITGNYVAEKSREAEAERQREREAEMQKEADLYNAFKEIQGKEPEVFKEIVAEKIGVPACEIEQKNATSGYGLGIEGVGGSHFYARFATEQGTFDVSTLPAHIERHNGGYEFRKKENEIQQNGIFYTYKVNARDERSDEFKEDLAAFQKAVEHHAESHAEVILGLKTPEESMAEYPVPERFKTDYYILIPQNSK